MFRYSSPVEMGEQPREYHETRKSELDGDWWWWLMMGFIVLLVLTMINLYLCLRQLIPPGILPRLTEDRKKCVDVFYFI